MGAEGWAIAIVGGAAAGLITAAILAIFKPAVRERFWKPIGRALRWPFTLRLTTTKRIDAGKAEVARLEAEVKEARVHKNAQRAADNLIEQQRREREAKQAVTRELVAHKRGREEALAEVAEQRGSVTLTPTWTIDDIPIRWAYELRNTQPGVTISDVSISADAEVFRFNSPTQWPGEFNEKVRFEGALTRHSRRSGATLTVRWRDANGDWQQGPAFIDREPVRAVVL